MHFSITFATLALGLGLASAAELPTHVKAQPPTLVTRDLAVITQVIADSDARIKDLTNAVNSFSGDPASVQRASNNLLSTIHTGVNNVIQGASITLNDAIMLQQSVTGLQNDGNALIQALNNKKNQFQQASLCDVVFRQTNDLGKAGKALIDAVVSKVPQETQQLAAQLASGFTNTLASAQQSFAPGNCTNANGGGTIGTGGASTVNNGTGTGTGTGSSSGDRTSGAPVAASAPRVLFSASVGALMCAVAVGLTL